MLHVILTALGVLAITLLALVALCFLTMMLTAIGLHIWFRLDRRTRR